MKFMNGAMTARAAMKAVTKPTAVAVHSAPLMEMPSFRRLYAEAATIVGMAR